MMTRSPRSEYHASNSSNRGGVPCRSSTAPSGRSSLGFRGRSSVGGAAARAVVVAAAESAVVGTVAAAVVAAAAGLQATTAQMPEEMMLTMVIVGAVGMAKTSSRYWAGSAGCSVILTDVNVLVTPTLDHHRGDGRGGGRRQKDEKKKKKKKEASAKDGDDARRCRRERTVQNLLQEALLRRTAQGQAGAGINTNTTTTTTSSSSSTGSGGEGRASRWFGSVTSSILSSLTVTVRNVHVRYEDPGSVPAFGSLRCCCSTSSVLFSGRGGDEHGVDHPTSSMRRKSLRSSREERQQHRPPFAVGLELRSFLIKNATVAPPRERDLFRLENAAAADDDCDDAMEDREDDKDGGRGHREGEEVSTAPSLG